MDNFQNEQPRPFSIKKLLFSVFGGLFLLIVVLLILDWFHVLSLSKLFNGKVPFIPTNSRSQKASDEVIVKVGNENIYQQDLTTELAYFPETEQGVDRDKLLIEKLVKDSTILQAAQEDALITLDTSVYNSSSKDYLKRIKLIAQVKEDLDKKKDRYKGSVIAVWFYNTKPGSVGYDRGKEIANQKITTLQAAVAGKNMTIDEAAKQIQNDSTLAQVDPAYKANAIFSFDTDLKEDIVFDKEFNRIIKSLEPGQVSPVTVVKDKELANGQATGKEIEAAYMFAQVNERTITGKNLGFDDWLAKRSKKYEVVYY